MHDFSSLSQLLRQLCQERIAGCGCAVTLGDETVFEEYLGYADLETKRKMAEDAVFRLYSMTKVTIFTVCMKLYEQGLFQLDDPLYEYMPEWRHMNKYVCGDDGRVTVKPLQNPILIKHVLTMAMGLPYGNPVAGYEAQGPSEVDMLRMHTELAAKGPYTLREEIAAAAKVPVAFEPGTHWLYGFGSEIAAGLIEILMGKEIEQALCDELFAPLGMNSTGMRFFGDIPSRLVSMYRSDKKGNMELVPPMFDIKHLPGKENLRGCPRLFSSVRDYAALGQMLANGGVYRGQRIMGRKTIDLMRTNHLNDVQLAELHHSSSLAGYGYGLGFRTLMTQAGAHANASLGEFGWSGGSGPWFSADPQEKMSITIMYQLRPSDGDYIHIRVRNVAYGCLN